MPFFILLCGGFFFPFMLYCPVFVGILTLYLALGCVPGLGLQFHHRACTPSFLRHTSPDGPRSASCVPWLRKQTSPRAAPSLIDQGSARTPVLRVKKYIHISIEQMKTLVGTLYGIIQNLVNLQNIQKVNTMIGIVIVGLNLMLENTKTILHMVR